MRKRKNCSPLSFSDKEFFDKFYETYKRFMFYYARKYVSTQTECEDLVQDAVVRLMSNVASIKGLTDSKARAYIVLTIKAAYLDHKKAKHGEDLVPLTDDTLELFVGSEQLEQMDEHGSAVSIDIAILKQELSPRDWFVLEGKYVLGCSQEEIGKLIGISPDSVRMVTSRARARARHLLSEEKPMEANSNGK